MRREEGNSRERRNPVKKCHSAAKRLGFEYFAVGSAGECFSSPVAAKVYPALADATNCTFYGKGRNGKTVNVYKLENFKPTFKAGGCFNSKVGTKNGTIPLPSLQGKDAVLMNATTSKADGFQRCMWVAKKRGFRMFAMQDGKCMGSRSAETDFQKLGKSSKCGTDGRGGQNANQMYKIVGECLKIINSDK